MTVPAARDHPCSSSSVIIVPEITKIVISTVLIHSFATVESVDLAVALSGSDFAELARSPVWLGIPRFPK
jgi:hypothetical protein